MKSSRVNDWEYEWKCNECKRVVALDLKTNKFYVVVRGNENFPHIISKDDYEPLNEFEFPWENSEEE
jgi:transposase